MEKHIWSSEDKLKYYGYGEWVEECDYNYFKHNGIECVIKRALFPKKYVDIYGYDVAGGHLCGYCKLPKNHPWGECKDIWNLEINVHGGITYEKNKIIGFDAAHFTDLVPYHRFIIEEMRKKNIKCPIIFNGVYRNMEYMKEECKKLADQIVEANK